MTAAERVRYALVQMVVRYGTSMQKMAYAEEPGGNVEAAERHRRAASRQFAATQRLANALTNLARGAR